MAERRTTQAGDISSAATWGGTLPAVGDNCYIDHACTLTGADFNIGSNGTLTISDGKSLNCNAARTLTAGNISGFDKLTISADNVVINGNCQLTNNTTWACASSFTINGKLSGEHSSLPGNGIMINLSPISKICTITEIDISYTTTGNNTHGIILTDSCTLRSSNIKVTANLGGNTGSVLRASPGIFTWLNDSTPLNISLYAKGSSPDAFGVHIRQAGSLGVADKPCNVNIYGYGDGNYIGVAVFADMTSNIHISNLYAETAPVNWYAPLLFGGGAIPSTVYIGNAYLQTFGASYPTYYAGALLYDGFGATIAPISGVSKANITVKVPSIPWRLFTVAPGQSLVFERTKIQVTT